MNWLQKICQLSNSPKHNTGNCRHRDKIKRRVVYNPQSHMHGPQKPKETDSWEEILKRHEEREKLRLKRINDEFKQRVRSS